MLKRELKDKKLELLTLKLKNNSPLKEFLLVSLQDPDNQEELMDIF